jgi:8-oxo-dGTP pyrophosphatase MutT (NUDIX family)
MQTIDPKSLPYRPCAGVMLLNRDGKVFVGQRIDNSLEAWQMPQGGIDEGEDAEAAAIREVGEETGAVLSADGGITAGAMIRWGGADLGSKPLFEAGRYGPPA